MRLARLDLTRYGRFTDQSIAFGPRRPGVPDLHLVYGPNEAGKSTAFNAFLDLLFGIHPQTPYGFLHDYRALRIGARLELEEGGREVVRIKRPQNSLLDAHGAPLPDGVVRAGLGGLDREAYRTMFSLDDETLEKGGEAILASKGELGELLFSASAGLADLTQRLGAVREMADGFYKYRARKGDLADLKARLDDLKLRREALDTQASAFAALVGTRDSARQRYDDAVALRARLRTELEAARRMLGALPRLADLRGARAELAALAGLPDARPGWAARLPDLQEREKALAVGGELVEAELRRLTQEEAGIPVDAAALACGGALADLGDLRARFVTARKDLPLRRQALEEGRRTVLGILARLGRQEEADPSHLLLPASMIGALRALMEDRSGLEADARRAREEQARAEMQHATARADLAATGGEGDPPPDVAAHARALADLAEVAASARSIDHADRLRRAAREVADAEALLQQRLRALAPWQGTADELVALALPAPATVQGWKRELDEAVARLRQHRAEAARLAQENTRLKLEQDAIVLSGILDDRAAQDLRAAREAAWAAHRRVLDGASADAFEAALRADDAAVTARAAHLQDLAHLRSLAASQAVLGADLAVANGQAMAAEAAQAALAGEIAGTLHAVAPALAGLGLAELEGWLTLREKAVAAYEAVAAARRELAHGEADAHAAGARLCEALVRAGGRVPDGGGLDAQLFAARARLDREDELRHRREAATRQAQELKLRTAAVDTAMAALVAWDAHWARACGACWLGDSGAPSLGAVREILAGLDELRPAVQQADELALRIGKMEADEVAFAAAVEDLAARMGFPRDGVPPQEQFRRMEEAVRAAEEARRRKAELGSALEMVRQQARGHAGEAALHRRQVEEITQGLGVPSLFAAAERLARIERRDAVRGDMARAAREIMAALGCDDAGAAEARLADADRAVLEADRARLEAEVETADAQWREAYADHQQAEKAIADVGGDDRVARLEAERRTTLLEIEEGAMRYMRLRAGTLGAARALAAYREQHRSSMMARASDTFRIISRGAYSGLAAQPGKDGEVLIALPAEGGAKAAAELSKGTRFQLYLALRVAGYHEFARSRPAPPFVADDIMETFDDFRAEEAFRVLADMAMAGQVIYLTHHRHLCEIVRNVCPDVQIHDLTLGQGLRPDPLAETAPEAAAR